MEKAVTYSVVGRKNRDKAGSWWKHIMARARRQVGDGNP